MEAIEMIDLDLITKAWYFASYAHKNQKMPKDNLPYVTHFGNVTLEVFAVANELKNPTLAITVAILHDTIEDTKTTFENIQKQFSKEIANGVKALSKDKSIASKQEQMKDSLLRIKKESKEIWVVKMADRVANLNEPPKSWSKEKKEAYLEEAKLILDILKDANKTIANRLKQKIENYKQYI